MAGLSADDVAAGIADHALKEHAEFICVSTGDGIAFGLMQM